MDLLVYLAQNDGDVVTTDDIITKVWAGVAVTNDSLYFSMSQLRKALDDGDGEASIIETLPKRGYRLMVPVEYPVESKEEITANPQSGFVSDPGPDEVPVIPAASRRKPLRLGLGVAAFVLVAVAAVNWFDSEPKSIDVPVAQALANSIAVMPFVDLTPESDYTYFSDGITEEILNRLTRVQGLRVAARTSSFAFKYKESDIVEIGESLGVTSVLEGSVRKEGDRVKISAQLIDATTGFQMWSNTYERELSSVFAIQNEISRRIIDALELTLTAALAENGAGEDRVMNPLALDEYLMGLEAHRTYSFESLRRAEDHFETALQIDPRFSQARVQLARTKFSILNTGASIDNALIDEAEILLRDALNVDPENGAAHRVLALVHQSRRELDKAEQELNKALALAPSDSLAIVHLAHISMGRGDYDKSLTLLERAIRIDPFGDTALRTYGQAQQRAGLFSEARETYSRAIDLHPSNPNNSWMLGKLQVDHLGEIAGGLSSFLNSAALDEDDFEIAAYVAMTYLSLEMPGAAEPWLKRALADGPDTVTSKSLEAVYLMLTGEKRRATQVAMDTLRDRPARFGSHSMLSDSLVIIAVDQLIEQGRADEAVALLEDAAPGRTEMPAIPLDGEREDEMDMHSDIPRHWLVALACAYQAAGQQQKAIDTLGLVVAARVDSIDANQRQMQNNDYLIEAEALAIGGDTSGALERLELAVDANLYFNWQIRIGDNYAFAGMQSEPRFIAVLDKVKAKIRGERLNVADPSQLAAIARAKSTWRPATLR
jgi:TolB-like protein/Flp pilus assembly protein TadD